MRVLFVSFLSALFIVLCLVTEHKGQIGRPDSGARQGAPSASKEATSDWQTVLLSEKGIKFKLPPDWRREGTESEEKNEYFTLQDSSWVSPNKELVRIYLTTYSKGFMSLNRTVISKEEKLEEEFNSVKQSAKSGSTLSDVKKLKVSGIEGVFRRLHINDQDIGERSGIIWTGYRIYQGNSQEVDINISASPKSAGLLPAIFNTLEIEQDRGAIAKP